MHTVSPYRASALLSGNTDKASRWAGLIEECLLKLERVFVAAKHISAEKILQ